MEISNHKKYSRSYLKLIIMLDFRYTILVVN